MKPIAAKRSWGSSCRTEIMTPLLNLLTFLIESLFLNNSRAFQDFKLIFLENVSLSN